MAWHHSRAAGLGVALMAAAACSGPRVVNGECQKVFGGDVCTFGSLTSGAATEFGATIAMTAVEGAPMTGDMVFPPVPDAVIPLPAEIARATGFSHLGVNWEMHGHPPALFLTPHFDFHFYTVAPDQVKAIDCADLRKPAALTPAYTLPDIEIPGMGTLVGLCVPGMGMHSMASAELDQVNPFGGSMIVGYYGGEPHFVEPMISKAKLMESRTFALTVPPAPQGLKANVRWPTRFEAVYDPAARAYRMVFSLAGN